MASMKWVGPTMRTRSRSISTTPGTARIAAAAFSDDAFGRAVEQGFHGGARQPQAQQRDHHGDADGGGGVAPGIAQPGQRQPDDDGDRAEHVGGKMQRVGGQRLAFGVARGAMQRPGAPEIHGDVDQQHDERDRRQRRRRRAFAQAARRIRPECRPPARRASRSRRAPTGFRSCRGRNDVPRPRGGRKPAPPSR